ncbi:hypothetical protein ACJ2A9_15055 [Anaerobacillus sp. MEB173]|uniref:hypothetical protein n=1 Tax=Anaerobacillus sp. MEB173 TaxID=3383345 RepID=UPI003F930ADA
MKRAASNEVKRGQAISFRIPSDTPDHLLKHLQRLKETEKRNFSSKIAKFVMDGVSSSFSREKETVTIPLPRGLTKAQRDWLKHEHSEALLGNIIYQLISDPVRSTALLASLNSNSVDIDQSLYLQEELNQNDIASAMETIEQERNVEVEVKDSLQYQDVDDHFDDDLEDLNWENMNHEQDKSERKEENDEVDDLEDLLGGFLAHMNK